MTTIAEQAAPIAMLIGELAAYRSRASKLNEAITDLMQWWRQNGATLPRWFALTCTVVLFQPSSAGAERVFSMLDGMFDADQAAALEDYKTAALMVRYNDMQRSKLEDARRPAANVEVVSDNDSDNAD